MQTSEELDTVSSAAGPTRSVRQIRKAPTRQKRSDLSCSFCNRLFAKPEHLKRHERTHLGAKQYSCSICRRTFGRPDSLKRHERAQGCRSDGASIDGRSVEDHFVLDAGSHDIDHAGLMALANATARDADLTEVTSAQTTQAAGDFINNAASTMIPEQFNQSDDVHIGYEPSVNQFGDYAWPGSNDLMEILINADAGWPMEAQVPFLDFNTPQSVDTVRAQHDHADGSYARARQAMQHMSNLMRDLSVNLAKEVEGTGVSSDFLDTCLNTFFDRFVPIFPVVHRPTFSIRDCASPLLLNMIVLGSLFTASEEAVTRGETLWRLAHAAVATSWQSMVNHVGSVNRTTGVQLVMTALLGQTYAVLSRSRSSRLTSQAFHGLGFYWARQCGLPVSTPFLKIPMLQDTLDVKQQRWKEWSFRESRLRALLGHYILDGLISQSSGLPTSDRHLTNTMVVPSCAEIYTAETVDSWIQAMQAHPQPTITFREVYLRLFDAETDFDLELCPLSIRVVLEGLQSLISDFHQAQGCFVGAPDVDAIGQALGRILITQIESARHSPEQKLDLLLRWHAICIELCVNTNLFMKHLCEVYSIRQDLYGSGIETTVDVAAWTSTQNARRAVLHASAILNLVMNLSFGRMQSIHIPFAVCSSAVVLLALLLNGFTNADLPSNIDWCLVCFNQYDRTFTTPESSPTHQFLDISQDVWIPSRFGRGFSYHLNTLQTILGSLSNTWGIAKEMRSIIRCLAGPIGS